MLFDRNKGCNDLNFLYFFNREMAYKSNNILVRNKLFSKSIALRLTRKLYIPFDYTIPGKSQIKPVP